MSSFESHAAFWTEYRQAAIDLYRDELRNVLLCRLVMPSVDPTVEKLARHLSLEIRCSYSEALDLLRPTASAIYAAAKEARP